MGVSENGPICNTILQGEAESKNKCLLVKI